MDYHTKTVFIFVRICVLLSALTLACAQAESRRGLRKCHPISCRYGEAQDPTSCQCVPRAFINQRCPQIQCPKTLIPCSKYKLDSRNCPICDCETCLQPSTCPRGCRFGTAFITLENNCKMCSCKLSSARCPERVCTNYCPYQRDFDANGCPSCTCKNNNGDSRVSCPPLKCERHCPDGRITDVYGCLTCACRAKPKNEPNRPPTNCPQVCTNYCPDGRVLDKRGCPTCQCSPSGTKIPTFCRKLSCSNHCPKGRLPDRNGCPSCRCRELSLAGCPALHCYNVCPEGRLIDGRGCLTCVCKNETRYEVNTITNCPVVSCGNRCPYGRLMDKRGCETCECGKCPPACKNTCINGRIFDKNGCPTCICNPPSNPNQLCKRLSCTNVCPAGTVTDQYGCPTCECKSSTTIQDNYCPKIDCTGDCPYGRFPDSRGCETCICRDAPTVAPAQARRCGTCKNRCHYGYTMILDVNECPTCRCRRINNIDDDSTGSRPTYRRRCPRLQCVRPSCPQGGIATDYRGCPTCRCKHVQTTRPSIDCPRQVCTTPCPNGRLRDRKGCPTCYCRKYKIEW